MASIKVWVYTRVRVVQVCRKGKRRLCRVDRKREGRNNYVRLFDLQKMQEKGVSPLWLPAHPVLHTMATLHTGLLRDRAAHYTTAF